MMSASDTDYDQAPRREPERPGETISIFLDDDLAARLACFQRRHPDFSDTSQAARHILRIWLTENGFDGVHAEGGIRPEALNSSNDD